MENLVIFKDIIPREKKVLSPLHLTEYCFVPRRLVSLDISALIKKAYHGCHLYVFSHAISSPKQNVVIYFSCEEKGSRALPMPKIQENIPVTRL